jgi:hypothetical protein
MSGPDETGVGQAPEIIARFEAVARQWNESLTPFLWRGIRRPDEVGSGTVVTGWAARELALGHCFGVARTRFTAALNANHALIDLVRQPGGAPDPRSRQFQTRR